MVAVAACEKGPQSLDAKIVWPSEGHCFRHRQGGTQGGVTLRCCRSLHSCFQESFRVLKFEMETALDFPPGSLDGQGLYAETRTQAEYVAQRC